jgi:hypothetical protein
MALQKNHSKNNLPTADPALLSRTTPAEGTKHITRQLRKFIFYKSTFRERRTQIEATRRETP